VSTPDVLTTTGSTTVWPVSDLPLPPGSSDSPPPPPAPSPLPASSPAPPPPPPGLNAPAGFVAYSSNPTPATPAKRVGGLGKAVVILTAIVALSSLVTTALSIGISSDAADFVAGETSQSEFEDALAPLSAVQGLATVATIAAGVVTIVWMFRMATNLRAYGRRTTWSPLFSIFGWFLPPMFLYVIPFLVLREQWKASEPSIVDGSDSWKATPDNRVLWVWFALYGLVPTVLFFAQVGSIVSSGVSTGDVDSLAESLDTVSPLLYVSAVAIVGAVITWIIFVRQLTTRHRALTGEV
jgi:Domain of unknown function (DUF4328)